MGSSYKYWTTFLLAPARVQLTAKRGTDSSPSYCGLHSNISLWNPSIKPTWVLHPSERFHDTNSFAAS